jgi:hypothetical protein
MTTRNTVNVIEGTVTVVEVITAGPQGPAGGGGGAGTDLSWDATTRTVASSTGTDAVITEATTALPGLMSAADKALVNQAATVTVAVRNNSGVTIPKGSAVYVTGTSGTTITVALADASTEATAAQTLGLAQDAIPHNSNGTVIAVGELTGLDTSALTEGAIIWLSETTGALTTTRPTQPAHGVVLGYCVKSGPGTSGIVYVKVDNGLELEELHDVLITSATTDQALMKAADGLWKNKTITPALIGAATAAQGALADSAVQPAALSSYLTTAAAATTYQPLDAGLSSIAALATTTFGRSLLTQADAAAARTTLDAAQAAHVHAVFTSSAAGYVPASGGGTTNFLRADGTFAAPAGGASTPLQAPAVNNWIDPILGATAASATSVANQISFFPFVLSRSITVGGLGARVTTVIAGSNIQLAIYSASGTTGLPTGSPLGKTVSLSGGTATTVSDETLASFTLNAGQLYWMASVVDVAGVVLQGVAASSTYMAWVYGGTLTEITGNNIVAGSRRTLANPGAFGTWPDMTSQSTSTVPGQSTLSGGIVFLKVNALP